MQDSTIYDVEPDQNSSAAEIQTLPKRVRFYHAMIDGQCLGSGEDYRNLKEVVVILITPYDPFGLNRMVYTVQNRCVEEPDMPYDDGAKTIYLYTRGKKGNPPEELQQFLTYMEHTTWENAVNSTLQEIQRMVDTAKTDKGVSIEYMKSFERDRRLREEGLAAGREEGLAAGREEGLAAGRAEERAHTEAERARADKAEEELRKLKERFGVE